MRKRKEPNRSLPFSTN